MLFCNNQNILTLLERIKGFYIDKNNQKYRITYKLNDSIFSNLNRILHFKINKNLNVF